MTASTITVRRLLIFDLAESNPATLSSTFVSNFVPTSVEVAKEWDAEGLFISLFLSLFFSYRSLLLVGLFNSGGGCCTSFPLCRRGGDIIANKAAFLLVCAAFARARVSEASLFFLVTVSFLRTLLIAEVQPPLR